MSKRETSSKAQGIPIYGDSARRKIVSSGDHPGDSWYPSTPPSRRLWACLEILRDVNDLLEDACHSKSSGKRKRRAKILAGHLHTLAKAVNDLCGTIIGEREVRKSLSKDDLRQVREIQASFANFVPFQWGSEFSTYRNKLVAHFDEKFWPWNANELLDAIPAHKIGYWLHICLHVILDLTKLDIYSWTCDSPAEGYILLMTSEPFIVTMEVDAESREVISIASIDIANESPRETVVEVVGESIEKSQWLFKRGQPRMSSLFEDKSEEWNTFMAAKGIYARI